jgi:hypothetical protein
MKMTVFSVVALCSLVEVYRRFKGTCCLHHVILCSEIEMVLDTFIQSLACCRVCIVFEHVQVMTSYAFVELPICVAGDVVQLCISGKRKEILDILFLLRAAL